MIPGAFPIMAGKTPATISKTAASSKTASGDHTYASVSLSTASADRYIAVCIGYLSGSQVPDVTIGGVSASSAVTVTNSDSRTCDIWIANVPTGTTGDIVIGALAGSWNSNIVVYAIVGAITATPHATVTDDTSALSLSLDVPQLGVGVFAGYYHVGTANAVTWTNATEDSDVFDGFSGLMTAASIGTAGTIAASVSANGTVTSVSGVAASFK